MVDGHPFYATGVLIKPYHVVGDFSFDHLPIENGGCPWLRHKLPKDRPCLDLGLEDGISYFKGNIWSIHRFTADVFLYHHGILRIQEIAI